ncbi:polyadenylate-binding protein-interacting protein 4-like isoform X2 [Macadamia integrifolia]|uniref:polyadenylate-binding protein-interacting protein 4-like isoform X2 n=1 Tax=Macadamia integrifolia TaxID=60698 RepID=UPI001C4EB28D|nr:polyadenylate-binding protein-interacting protein 4-like isoform X2 [Macadamia integrifolia]
MSLQQVVPQRSSANGFGRRRVEREMGTRLDCKLQSGKSNTISFANAGALNGGEVGGYGSPSRDRLIYLTTCLIGHCVEVQVKNGTIFSGIFHATGAEKDFGVILKMARLIKDGSFTGQKSLSDSSSKPPSKTLIIPAKELVQIIAKDVPLSSDGSTNGLQLEKRQDIMTDTLISQSHYVDLERELGRWTPDEDDPQLPELENIFNGTWNRNWDQFETNEALFGVKSTFDEELYTTKLERGPQMRDLEREASRIAREIEGEETQDLHLAEERGFCFHEDFDIDEETRFSSVFRGANDSGYEESEDMTFDLRNTEGFGGSSGTVISRSFSDLGRGKSDDGPLVSSSTLSMDDTQSSQSNASKDLYRSSSSDHTKKLTSDSVSKSLSTLNGESGLPENQFRERHGGKGYPTESPEWKTLLIGEEAQKPKSEDLQSSLNMKKPVSDKGGLSPSATAFAPSSFVSSKGQENTILGESSDSSGSGKLSGATQAVNSRGPPGSSASSTPECVGAPLASNVPGLSPSSSMGSLSSEKSSLNPNAKEFKLNPNAKSFTPTQTVLRPPSPVSENSFYFPANMSPVPHMHGVPVIAPSFGHQPMIYSPPATPMQTPQAYVQPNGPLYGQQMILGHPRQVLYMPGYPPEMPYKGREF